MKFVPIASAKIKVTDEVYTLDKDGKYNTGKLVSKNETAEGTTHEFEVPQYFNPAAPSINPVKVTNITHVCKMSDRKQKDEEVASAS